MSSVHLGFDMGIRNLAYCVVKHNADGKWSIEKWDNVDLLEGGTSAQDAKRCIACKGPAKWISNTDSKKWCNACATQTRVKKAATEKPVLPTISCTLTVKALKALATERGVADTKTLKKDQLIAWASANYLLPWKPAKTMQTSLTDIRKSMDKWLDSVLPTFATTTLIRLENQPVMKGPTMKSVQIILFTLLGHRLEKEYDWKGKIEFVHAGVKTKAAEAEAEAETASTEEAADDGKAYRKRKKTAETETSTMLTTAGLTDWLLFFNSRSKKSDLADAFLMAVRPARSSV